MALYIVPFDYETKNSVNSLRDMELSCLFYKSVDGPLGFYLNEESEKIFLDIIQNSIWFSVVESEFYRVDEQLFEKRKHGMEGLFFLDDSEFRDEINSIDEVRRLIIKNKLLLKYNKALIPTPSNIIIESFTMEAYDKNKIEQLLINKNVLIWNRDAQFGVHIIFHNYDQCLLMQSLNKYEVHIRTSINDIPLW